jgi:chromosome segregation ATPase
LEDTIKRYEERLRSEREELIRDSQDKVTRVTAEKESVEAKYDVKRKALKDIEATLARMTAQNDRERAVLTEKCNSLDSQLRESTKTYDAEILRLKDANEQLTLALNGDKAYIQEELEKQKRENAELDRKNQDLANTYDRELALWEGKFKFLEQQRDTAKKDYDDAMRNFQATIDRQAKNANEQKSKLENAQQLQLL